jgi:hypothetical protein
MPSWVAHPAVALVDTLEWLLSRAAGTGSLLVLVALGHSALKVLPPYLTHHRLHDQLVEIARMPVAGDPPRLRTALMRAVEERRLEAYIRESDLSVESRGSSRRITCRYQVPVELLPGRMRVFQFQIDVEQPVVVQAGVSFI